MIEKLQIWIINIILTLSVLFAFTYFKQNKEDDALLVFSSKNIIEHKKLLIKKAILNNSDINRAENQLEKTIKEIDLILNEISSQTNKPIFKKEVVLTNKKIKDITYIVEKRLKEKGLL
jgi:hypothetical protein